MPDHMHVLVVPRVPRVAQVHPPVGARSSGRRVTPVSGFVAGWANSAAHLANRALATKGPLWQEGFHDHALRRTEDIGQVVDYIHGNPVRRGLAVVAEAWPWSSASPEYALETDWDWVGGNRPEDGAPTPPTA
jgi:REP element-mobilizing transposase RayT